MKITREKLGEQIYLVAFGLYVFVYFFSKTMFSDYILHDLFTKFIKMIILGAIFYKFLFCDKYNVSCYIILLLVSICILLATYKSHNMGLFNFFIMVVGAYRVSFYKINQLFVLIVTLLLLITIFASQIGAIDDLVYEGYRSGIYTLRHSFGIIYPTDFAATCFFLLVSFAYILSKNKIFLSMMLYIFVGVFLIYFCDARLDGYCVFLLAFVMCLYKLKLFILNSTILKLGLIGLPLFCGLFSILSSYYFSESESYWSTLNQLLSGRLNLGQKAIVDYGFTIFGTEIEMNGLGGETNQTFNEFYEYFYIDSSFLRIILNYGMIPFLLLIIALTRFNYVNLKHGRLLVVMLLSLVCINGIVAHHIIDIIYTPFLLCFTAKINRD